MLEWIFDNQGAFAVDRRTHPVFITTWHGVPTVKLVDRYFRWSDAMVAAAMAGEQRLIRIADLREAWCPPAAVQKRLFEHVRHDVASEVTLISMIVTRDPRLRALTNAVRFICGSPRRPNLVVVETMDEAIEAAAEALQRERIPVPRGLDVALYQPPRLASALI